MADILPRDILFRAGGRTLARYGVPAIRRGVRGWEAAKETLARADSTTCATWIDRGGVLHTAAANKLRTDWSPLHVGLSDAMGLLIEPSRTNAFDRSMEFDHANWTKTRCSATVNATTAPDGTTTAEKLVEDSSASTTHFLSRNTPTLTNSTLQPWSCFVKAAERTFCALELLRKDNTVLSRYFNLSTGALGSGSAAAHILPLGTTGWYRCSIMVDCLTGATAPNVRLYIASADGTASYTGNGTSGIYIWGGQFETDSRYPTAFIPTTTATVTRAGDTLTYPLGIGPDQDITVGLRLLRPSWFDVTGDIGGFPVAVQLGSTSSSDPAISITFDQTTRAVFAAIDTLGTDVSSSLSVPAGNDFSMVAQFRDLTTGGKAKLDVGAGFGSESGAATGFSTWLEPSLILGGPAGVRSLGAPLVDVMVLRGLFTRAEYLAVP